MVVFSFSISTFLARPSHGERHVFELDTEVLADHLAAGEDGDVLQHGLAAVAEARGLHGGDLQAATQLVDHQRGQRFTLDVLGDDEQGTARLHHRLEEREQRLQRAQASFRE